MVRPSLTSQENSNNAQSQSHRQHRASAGSKRLSGRPSYKASTSSLNSLNSLSLSEKSDGNGPEESHRSQETQRHHHGLHRTDPSRLVSQILDWLHDEKRKRSRRKGSYGGTPASQPFTDGSQDSLAGLAGRLRRPSNSSDRSLALEKLEQILAENNVVDPAALQTSSKESRPHTHARRTSSIRLLRRKSSFGPSSDTEYYEGDAIVPATDVVLDNSKTMGFSGGASDSSLDLLTTSKRVAREREGWLEFKNEIVKLAHTLRLKGWRRVPLDRGGDLHVERLSGALTNAVYVVSPPDNLPPVEVEGMNGTNSKKLKRKSQ
jgi:choline kinase